MDVNFMMQDLFSVSKQKTGGKFHVRKLARGKREKKG